MSNMHDRPEELIDTGDSRQATANAPTQRPEPADEQARGSDGTTFKREGPEPAEHDTGRDVEDMNRRAEESVIRNIRPDEAVD